MDALVIIGLGGIGGAIAEPLCRYLEHSGQIKQVKLIDGDRYEARNSERQQAVVGQNKAEAWAKRLSGSFRNLTVSGIGSFITPDNIRLHLTDNSIIMLGVDNHATRLLVQEHCSKLRNVVLISGGVVSIRKSSFRPTAGRMNWAVTRSCRHHRSCCLPTSWRQA